MDETWIGQIMKLASKCHKRTMQLTTLQRYYTGQRNKFGTLCVLKKILLFSEPGLKAELEAALASLRCELRRYHDRMTALAGHACGFMTCLIHDVFSSEVS